MDNYEKKWKSFILEDIDMAAILSHDNYKTLYIGNKSKHDAADEEEQINDKYIINLNPGVYKMIFWDNDGPKHYVFDNKLDFVLGTISDYWGEDQFIEKFGIEDKINAAGDNREIVFNKHVEDNLDMYYEEIIKSINNSYPDEDSANGVALLVNDKLVAGASNKKLIIKI